MPETGNTNNESKEIIISCFTEISEAEGTCVSDETKTIIKSVLKKLKNDNFHKFSQGEFEAASTIAKQYLSELKNSPPSTPEEIDLFNKRLAVFAPNIAE